MFFRIVGIGSTVLSGMIAARYLTKDDVGRLSVLLNQIGLWSIIGGLGLNRLLVRLTAQYLANNNGTLAQQVLKRGEYLLLGSLLLTGIVSCVLLQQFGKAIIGQQPTANQCLLTTALIVLYGWHQVTGELLRGMQYVRAAGLFGAPPGGVGPAVGLASLLVVLGTAVSGQLTLELFLLWHVCVAGILCLPAIVMLWQAWLHLPALSIALKEETTQATGQAIWIQALPLMLMQVLIFLGAQADIWIAGRELGEETTAIFANAKRISFFITLPLQFAQLTAVASIAHLYAQGEKQRLQRLLQRSALLAFIPATLLTIIAGCFPALVLRLFYGAAYEDGALLLQILAVGTWVYMATGLCSLTLIMTGHERVAFPVTVVSALLLFVGGTLGAQWYGALGLAFASTTVLGFSNIAQWWLARRYVGVWVHPAWTRAIKPAERNGLSQQTV
jgi:O-antigen/teichoic acid export membrane protein